MSAKLDLGRLPTAFRPPSRPLFCPKFDSFLERLRVQRMALIVANAFRPPSVLPALADTEQRRLQIGSLILGRRCEGGPDLASSQPNKEAPP